MGHNRPTNFLALDADHVVISFDGLAPLQVWNLQSLTKVREFEGTIQWCYALIALPNARLAVGCSHDGTRFVDIYDMVKGKILQRIPTGSHHVTAMGYDNGHLIVASAAGLRVWKMGPAGKVSGEQNAR